MFQIGTISCVFVLVVRGICVINKKIINNNNISVYYTQSKWKVHINTYFFWFSILSMNYCF